jgi:hypothetical protein
MLGDRTAVELGVIVFPRFKPRLAGLSRLPFDVVALACPRSGFRLAPKSSGLSCLLLLPLSALPCEKRIRSSDTLGVSRRLRELADDLHAGQHLVVAILGDRDLSLHAMESVAGVGRLSPGRCATLGGALGREALSVFRILAHRFALLKELLALPLGVLKALGSLRLERLESLLSRQIGVV